MKHIRNYAHIEKLNPSRAEKRLISACKEGRPCVLGDGTRPVMPDPDTVIRVEILRYLILGGCDDCIVPEVGVDLVGAFITGSLNLDYCKAHGRTHLTRCRFDRNISANGAQFNWLKLSGSAVRTLAARGINVLGRLELNNKFSASGGVYLTNARIGATFTCRSGYFANEGGDALHAHAAEIKGNLILDKGFHSVGEVNISSAEIYGQLSCAGGMFENPGGDTLSAQGIYVGGGIFLSDGFQSLGCIRLPGATVKGQINCTRGRFICANDFAINAQNLIAEKDVYFDDSFSKGTVSLNGAKITGQLGCHGAMFVCEDGDALDLASATIGEDAGLSKGFHAFGTVDLFAANITGGLYLHGGYFEGNGGKAFNGKRLRIGGALEWKDVTIPKGRIDLSEASVGTLDEELECWPADGRLFFDGLTYGRIGTDSSSSAKERTSWLQRGTSRLNNFYPQPYAELANVLKKMGHERDARLIRIAATNDANRNKRNAIRAEIHFFGGLRSIMEDPTKEVIQETVKSLDALPSGRIPSYKRLVERIVRLKNGHQNALSSTNPKDEILHINETQDFRNHLIFEQLNGWARWSWNHITNFLMLWLVGHGYRPSLAARWLMALIFAAGLLAQQTYNSGAFVPNSASVINSASWRDIASDPAIANPAQVWASSQRGLHGIYSPGRDWETFNAWAYGADLVIPIISLGQTSSWSPSSSRSSWGWLLWWARWFFEGFGWFISALGAAAITGMIRRD